MEDSELNELRAQLALLRKQEEVLFHEILKLQEIIFAEVDKRATRVIYGRGK